MALWWPSPGETSGLTRKRVLKARIKVQLESSLTEQLQTWEKYVLQKLVDNECDKCRQLVSFLFTNIKGHLTGISPGCFQLTMVFTDRMKLDRGTSPEALSAIREFLDSLLLTKDMENAPSDLGFSISVLDLEVYDSTARFHSRLFSHLITIWFSSYNFICAQIYNTIHVCFVL